MNRSSRLQRHHKASIVSLILHLLLVVLLFLGILTDEQPPFRLATDEQSESETPAQVIFSPQAAASALEQEPATAGHEREEAEIQEESPTSPEEELPLAEPHTPAYVYQTRHERRNRWRKATETAEAKPSMQQALQKALQYSVPRQDDKAHQAGIQKRVQAGFTHDALQAYWFKIARTICFELNRRHIIESPVDLPSRITIQILVDPQGNLVNIELDRSAISPIFAHDITQAITSAAPFAPLPQKLYHLLHNGTMLMNFIIHPSDMMNAGSTEKSEITFYLQDRDSHG